LVNACAGEVPMRVHAKGLLVLAVFVVIFAMGVDWRWGIAGIVAVAVIDFLSLVGPVAGTSQDRGPGRKVG
jgi:hypothetical protein